MFEIPCKVKTENWYWNRQLQIKLAEHGIRWGYDQPVGWNARTIKHLVVARGKNANYLTWMTRYEFENISTLPEYSVKELCAKL